MPDQNFNKGHEIEDGVSFNDVLGLSGGVENPWDVYANAPPGSVYFRSDGTRFILTGGGDDWTVEADWIVEPAGASSPDTLAFAIFLCTGGLVFNLGGEPLTKVLS